MSYDNFQIRIPITLVGPGQCKEIGRLVKNLGGGKIIIITDKNIVGNGLLNNIQQSLESNGHAYSVFDGCLPDAPSGAIDDCLREVEKNQYNLIIGIGGGSTLDTAKAVSVLAANHMRFGEFEFSESMNKPITKILIPTTAGTGSEWSKTGVFFDDEKREFKVLFHDFLFADAVIIDPETTYNLPQKVTADSGMDALAHAVEAYQSPLSNLFSDFLAESAIKLVSQNLRLAYAKGDWHRDARFRLSIAASMGMGAAVCASSGLAHMMNVEVGKRAKVPHGEIVSLLLPYTMEFNLIVSYQKLERLANLMAPERQFNSQSEAARESIESIRRLAADVGLTRRLSDMGIRDSDIPEMAETIMTNWAAALKEKVPRQVKKEDIVDIFNASM